MKKTFFILFTILIINNLSAQNRFGGGVVLGVATELVGTGSAGLVAGWAAEPSPCPDAVASCSDLDSPGAGAAYGLESRPTPLLKEEIK